jgi:hypothetical protein
MQDELLGRKFPGSITDSVFVFLRHKELGNNDKAASVLTSAAKVSI